MAKDELQPFLQLGPFLGLDNANSQPMVAAGYAISSTNVNTYRRKGALMPERGRVFLADFAAYLTQINVLAGITTDNSVVQQDDNQLFIQGVNGATLVTLLYDIQLATTYVISNALICTQAVQYGQVLYTNGGQRLFLSGIGLPTPQMYDWQYTGVIPGVDLETPATGGNIPQETRYYVFTQVTLMPDGTTSETSPENFANPRHITTSAGDNNSVTITAGQHPSTGTFTITGTPTDGQVNNYVISGTTVPAPQATGNTVDQQVLADVIYINNSLLPVVATNELMNNLVVASAPVINGGVLTLTSVNNGPVANLITTTASTSGGDTLTANQATMAGGGAGGVQFTDVNTGPNGQTLVGVDGTSYTTNIYAQSSLQAGYFLVGNMSRNTTFVDTLSDEQLAAQTPLLVVNGSAFQRDPPPVGPFEVGGGGHIIENLPFIRVHKNCMFIFTHIDEVEIAGSPPTCQLWYSQVGKPWEFSSDTRVLLLQDPIESQAQGLLSPDYNSPRGDYAKALASAGSYLLCVKKAEMWLTYGDGTDSAPFTQQRILDFGATSIRAVTPCVGGAFVETENGLYFFDGQSPQYEEATFRTVNADPRGVSLADAIHSVGVFSNMSYYLFYPTLGKGFVYNTQVGDWITSLPYSPFTENAIFCTPSDASSTVLSAVNRVVAVRNTVPTTVDFLFADDSFDLGLPMTSSWQGPETDNPGTDYKKEYSCLTVWAPIQNATINVKLTVDGVLRVSENFDLSKPRPLIFNFSAQGYSANLECTVTGTAGNYAPEIWKVTVWGISSPARRLTSPQ